jgi:hypothetical protein
VFILHIGHGQLVAGLAVDHDWMAGMVGLLRIIILGGEFIGGGVVVGESHRFNFIILEHSMESMVEFGVCVFAAFRMLCKGGH